MRSTISLLFGALLLAVAGSCSCGETENITPQPELRVELAGDPTGRASYLLDFGDVAVGARAAEVVVLRNVGARPLVMVAEQVSEPFSVERLAEALELGAGASGEVILAFSPFEATAAPIEIILDLETNEPEGTQHSLRLTGRGVRPLVTCQPSTLDFERVVRGAGRVLTTTCTNSQEIPVELASMGFRGNAAPHFSASLTGGGDSTVIPAGGSIGVEIRFAADLSGLNEAVLMLRDPNDQELGSLPVTGIAVVSSLQIDPASCLQFGYVELGGSARKTLRLTNVGADELKVLSMELADGDVSGFSLHTAAPIALSRGAEATLEVAFEPTVGGRQTATIEIGTGELRTSACVSGFGGGPKLVCSPGSLDFGPTAIGAPVDLPYHCINEGFQPPGEGIDRLVVEDVITDSPLFAATFLGPDGQPAQPDPKGYGIGEGFSVLVTFDPDEVGAAEGNAILTTKASAEPYETPLAGVGVLLPPCDFRLTPVELQFGVVNRGDERTVDVGVENLGSSACLIGGVRLSAGSSGAFRVEERTTVELAANSRMVIPVTFAPEAYGAYVGELELQVSNPAMRHQKVPLHGRSAQVCISVEPGPVDFGRVEPGCESRDRRVTIRNVCGLPLTVSGLAILETATSSSFQLRQPLGRTELQPHEDVTAMVRFLPGEEGWFEGALHVQVEGDPDGYVANLVGEGALDTVQTDVYLQQAQPKVDVLWVIDNTPSMGVLGDVRGRLNLDKFLSAAKAQGIDYQLGVTTSAVVQNPGASCPGGAACAEQGRLFPIDGRQMNPPWPRILTAQLPYDINDVWNYNVQVGGGARNQYEAPFEAARLALSPPLIDSARDPRPVGSCVGCKSGFEAWDDGNLGFLREDAHLSIVVVTEEKDASETGLSPMQYLDVYRRLKKPALRDSLKFHAITVPHTSLGGFSCGNYGHRGDRLLEVVTATKGEFFNICTRVSDVAAWDAGMERLSEGTFGVPARFVLRGTPADRNASGSVTEADLEVLVGGLPMPPRRNGVDVWKYDAANNAVDFTPLYRPAPGETISVTYQSACIAN